MLNEFLFVKGYRKFLCKLIKYGLGNDIMVTRKTCKGERGQVGTKIEERKSFTRG
jgi:hypothetical protein